LFFNAAFKDTHDVTDLYTSQQVVEEEEVIYCEESFGALKFSNIEQAMGVGLVHIAAGIRDIYDESIIEGNVNISDFSLHKIEHKLGGLRDIDFIKKPSASRSDEVLPVKIHRKIVNSILDSILDTSDSVLMIGGDGGSGSKRRRSYNIDCLYYTKKSFLAAQANRRLFAGRGTDFEITPTFISNIPIDKYKVILFNYCSKKNILTELINKFKDTKVIVMGIVCDPKLATDSRIKNFTTDKGLQKYKDDIQKGIEVRSGKGPYQVLGISPSKVAIYTDHGVFIDDRWYEDDNFISFNRTEIMKKLNINGTFDGIEHGSLKILKNAIPLIDSLSYRLSENDYDSFIDTMRIYKVEGGQIYDEHGDIYFNYTTLPDTKLACYRSSKDKKMRFFDVEADGAYWSDDTC